LKQLGLKDKGIRGGGETTGNIFTGMALGIKSWCAREPQTTGPPSGYFSRSQRTSPYTGIYSISEPQHMIVVELQHLLPGLFQRACRRGRVSRSRYHTGIVPIHSSAIMEMQFPPLVPQVCRKSPRQGPLKGIFFFWI
jgi:hypothetical protein